MTEVLRAAGGELDTREAIVRVGKVLNGELRPIDYAKLPSGEERWINAIRFARKELIDDGTLDQNAPHGVWRLKRR